MTKHQIKEFRPGACLIPAVLYLGLFLACQKPAAVAGRRIISLSPGMTEVIFAIGGQDWLVGVTSYCDYPPAARTLPRVGDFSHPSLERIIRLKPDLVIVNLPEQQRIKQDLEKMNIPVFVSAPESLNDIYREIVELGRRIGRLTAAESLAAQMRKRIQPVPRRRCPVYLELSPRPLITVGRNNFLSEMVACAGGQNIFADLDRSYPVIPQEEVIRRNPAVIIVLHPQSIQNRIGWSKIDAVRNHRIYSQLNPDLLLRPGPRLVEGFEVLKQILE